MKCFSACVAIAMAGLAFGSRVGTDTRWRVEITPLGPVVIDPHHRPPPPPWQQRVTVERIGNGQFQVVVDGKAGPAFDDVSGHLRVAEYTRPDYDHRRGYDDGDWRYLAPGGRVAYAGRRGRRSFVVIDGKEGPPVEGIPMIVFSRDGRHFLYEVKERTKSRMVIDGRSTRLHDDIGPFPTFTPDGRAVHAARDGKHWFMVVGGKPGPKFTGGLGLKPLFSPHGKRMAYVARHTEGDVNHELVVIDGKPGPRHKGDIREMAFSPDGERFAYVVGASGGWYVMLDGKAGGKFDSICCLSFSPDSRHLAYVAARKGAEHVVYRGRVGPAWSEIAEYDRGAGKHENPFLFSRDGKRLVYHARAGKGQGPHASVIVAFGEDTPPLPGWGSSPAQYCRFSPSGAHLAVATGSGGVARVLLDGKPGPDFGYVSCETLRFLSDSVLQYEAQRNRTRYRVRHVWGPNPTGPEGK